MLLFNKNRLKAALIFTKEISMVIFPKKAPVIDPLNSYYVDMPKLCEHYQGAIGTGVIYCKSHPAEACVFFDKDELLSGVFYHNGDAITGKAAIDRVLDSSDHNYEIHIYLIPPEEIYFWSNIPSAKKIYDELSSEFADLDGLIRKMSSEKLTGYIYVSINSDYENGYIFFINGEILFMGIRGNGWVKKRYRFVDKKVKGGWRLFSSQKYFFKTGRQWKSILPCRGKNSESFTLYRKIIDYIREGSQLRKKDKK